jgi:2-amino-4-hydroxy-6-hydroxymethyldihydropteridine diphosphokinase
MHAEYLYLVALGSNQRHSLVGSPHKILESVIAALEMPDISVFKQSRITTSRPVGPSQRTFANSAAILYSSLSPAELLFELQQVEIHFGRTKRGRKWRERTLDIDILLWSGGIWASDTPNLAIPHIYLQERDFVLSPASEIAGEWRDPLSNLTIKQLFYRLMHPKPLDRRA